MELISLLFASVLIMMMSLSGIIFVTQKLKSWTEANMQYLVAFSAGVFLIVSYDVSVEAIELGTNTTFVFASIIFGFLTFFIFERLYPEVHCHHDDAKCLTTNSRRGANKVLIGDGFHNIADGLLLAPVFMIDIKLGLVAAFGILVHEFVQEISEYFVLRSAGYTQKEALVKNFIVSSTILIGAVIGFYVSSFEFLIGPLLGLAAGAFIYILVIDLIPESVKNSHKERKYLNYAAWALLGVLLILSVDFFSGGDHGHELETDHHEDEYQEDLDIHDFDL